VKDEYNKNYLHKYKSTIKVAKELNKNYLHKYKSTIKVAKELNHIVELNTKHLG